MVATGPPEGIGDHLAVFRPTVVDLFSQGWQLAQVDLNQLLALQALTFCDHYAEVTNKLDSHDRSGLAALTLPLPHEVRFNVAPNQTTVGWSVTADDPHLRVIAAVQNPDTPTFSFTIGFTNSIVKVAEYAGRHFCHDGHHRVYQLLRRGIQSAPVLLQSFASFSEVAPAPNLLAEAICMGDHPPYVHDLLDSVVSADVLGQATRKMVALEAHEYIVPV
jgi:hypothetical protein